MKSLILAVFSFLFLSSCAFYAGLKDPITHPQPTEKTAGTTVATPPPNRSNAASMEQNNAATTASKMMSPITH